MLAAYSSSASSYIYTDFYKNASDVTETANLSGKSSGLTVTNHTPTWVSIAMQWLDTCSENSTSEKTYKVSARRHSSSGTIYLGWGASMYATLVMTEIAT